MKKGKVYLTKVCFLCFIIRWCWLILSRGSTQLDREMSGTKVKQASVSNIDGGCYAKHIDLSIAKEPEIWNGIKFGTESLCSRTLSNHRDSGKRGGEDCSISSWKIPFHTECEFRHLGSKHEKLHMKRGVQVYHQKKFKQKGLLHRNGLNGEGGCIRTKPHCLTQAFVRTRAQLVRCFLSWNRFETFASLPRACEMHAYQRNRWIVNGQSLVSTNPDPDFQLPRSRVSLMS